MNVFAIRHGETAWSLSGQHTGTTDIPLTDNGRRLAEQLRPVLAEKLRARSRAARCSGHARPANWRVSANGRRRSRSRRVGLRRVRGPDDQADPGRAPGWLLFRDGCPGGETPEQVGARVDRVIARGRAADGDVALFAHGHVLRVLGRAGLGSRRGRSAFPSRYGHAMRSRLLPRRTSGEESGRGRFYFRNYSIG